ncbi:hypothetical protein AB0B52_29755 [Streptomyces griseofuscus]|uniref:hypothetical protein n=1 Tax=Streptomyces griseofuscus TaxID=146922 RepID=UPI0033C5B061
MLVAQLLIHKMLLEEFRKMLNQLLKHRDGHTVPRELIWARRRGHALNCGTRAK